MSDNVNTQIGLARWMTRTGYPLADIATLAASSGIALTRLTELLNAEDPHEDEIGPLAQALKLDQKLGETDVVIYYTGEWKMAPVLAGEE